MSGDRPRSSEKKSLKQQIHAEATAMPERGGKLRCWPRAAPLQCAFNGEPDQVPDNEVISVSLSFSISASSLSSLLLHRTVRSAAPLHACGTNPWFSFRIGTRIQDSCKFQNGKITLRYLRSGRSANRRDISSSQRGRLVSAVSGAIEAPLLLSCSKIFGDLALSRCRVADAVRG